MNRQKRGYKIAAIAVAGLMLAAGCGGDDDDSASSGDNGNGEVSGSITLRGCKPQNPLIPTNTNETCGGNVLDAVTAKLVRYNPEDGSPQNDIAESIETEDAITYTIKIKPGVMFHDGTEVKAKNFVDAWNFGAYGPNAQLSSYFFEVIDGYDEVSKEKATVEKMSGLKVVDDYTFTVKMASKNSTFPLRLGYTAFAPLPDSFFTDDGEAFGKKPIGAGPYKVLEADPDRQFRLEAVEGYDRVGKPVVKNVTFKVFQDATAAYNEVVANQLDMTDEIPTSALTDLVFQKDLDGRFVERVVGVFQAINFPSPKADKSYDNVKLRQAISMAINRQQIIDVAFAGTREPATGWVSPVVDGYKPGACDPYCTYDADEAKKLYEESGGHNGPIRIGYNGDADHKPWVEATCNSIKNALGVECLPSPTVDFATFRTAITEREQKGMFRAGWQMDYPSAENFLAPLYGTGAGSNDSDYSNKAFDQQLRKAAALTDPEERNAAYQEAERMLAKDMPSIPLWHGKRFIAYSNKIASMKQTVFGTYDLSSIVLK